MNVVLLVIDSLRAASLDPRNAVNPSVPFLSGLDRETVCFKRAYATECWTLPTHCSMFTGLLPSQHGAHFGTMAYTNEAPTIAELLSAAGFETEVVTRNFVFDGTIPGIIRGFRHRTSLLSTAGGFNPFALFLAMAKPRFRRHIRSTGFFHQHRNNRAFLATFARAMMPADRLSLDHTLERMTAHRRNGSSYFLFVNLYDVHAPYPPTESSILRSFLSLSGVAENLTFPYVMSRLGGHNYLLPGFHLSEAGRRMLLRRYHTAIELMDTKLDHFFRSAQRDGLLEDTVVILTSDHGEAFGDHGLYLHDASVYDTHLRVPLWVHWPGRAGEIVAEVVSTRDLFGLIRRAAFGENWKETILDAAYRARRPIALAEHFHYQHAEAINPAYKQDIAAAIGGTCKVIRRREGLVAYNIVRDPEETAPEATSLERVSADWLHQRLPTEAISAASGHLTNWRSS